MADEIKSDEKNNEQDQPRSLDYYFDLIEDYFKKKEEFIRTYKHVSLEEILKDAPKYYSLIRIIETINSFISKDKNWLQHFIEKNNIKFDWRQYERWKASITYNETKYDETLSPSKWIHVLQDFFIELLKDIQILLVMEFYIDEESYKKFIRKDSYLYFKIIANYKIASRPSEDITLFFKLIDYLLKLNIEYDFATNLVVDTALCIKVYRNIDNSKIFELLKRKEFYIKYRLEYLKKCPLTERTSIPYEQDVIKMAEKFLTTLADLRFTYNSYKNSLIEKKDSFMKKKP